jgi:transcriptional regulator with PAS, ATPase and Fis domain
VTIGRGRDCDLRIDHASVSRKHALVLVGDPLRLEDLNSSNGSVVRGIRLDAGHSVLLRGGDLAALGEAFVVWQPAVPRRKTAEDNAPVIRDGEMQKLHRFASLVAQGGVHVMVRGEAGVGKQVLAEVVHAASPRADRPFVRIDCGVTPDALFEAELFGYERGAFPGASKAKAGLIEAADGGTAFLDEVGALSLAMQAKVLRVMEAREVVRLGAIRRKVIDVRVIGSSGRDLEAMMADGAFLSELYYRLNGATLEIPPLRERPAEILLLGERFMAETTQRFGRAKLVFSKAAKRALTAHSWPGNIRELQTAVERAVLLCEGKALEPAHLQVDSSVEASRFSVDVEAAERRSIEAALLAFNGNQTAAAAHLGISRRKLIGRIEAWGMPRPRKRPPV